MKNMKVGLFNEDCMKGDKKYKKKCLSNRKCVSHNNSSNKEGLTSSLSSSSVE